MVPPFTLRSVPVWIVSHVINLILSHVPLTQPSRRPGIFRGYLATQVRRWLIRVSIGCPHGPQEIPPRSALSWGVAQHFRAPILAGPCSVAAQALPLLPSPKVLVAELCHCLLGHRPWLCSRQPEDALLGCRSCSAGRASAQVEAGQDSHY